MAIKDNIKPTRSELIELKKKIKLSQSGHKLLKMKRDGLILELFAILEKARDVRAEVEKQFAIASLKLAIAKSVEGIVVVKSTAFALKDTPKLELESRNVMGVVVPKIDASSVHKRLDEHGYGIIGTSSRIDEAVDAYEILVEKVILAAEIETTMKKLLEDIEKTKRRVNALEFKVIPELTEARDFIVLRLEEMERENTFRLKKIKG
ncbi:H(+)-transporting ATP synthase, vacuolar type, subunit D [Candidatus Methanoperedens nitroreducens]|uniref:A-type ATP synthase subunit D n=1 Tax=Candidatus Methanoperedens nitratireducens TaxID=1392998 RepID=A0A062V6C6_9EURY|nr:V-type ATP synthase subunit D [Candidatus Methanoperedens nitroreducens]KCZ71339.1 H(+)-transporting ATP synthase, vacuolar type, subunit D [Candidatus Methanoperedens nitroreducens]MDJ1420968.1 V-type ATP synthase subunit D [Candidatus Methanoperedens sp.]